KLVKNTLQYLIEKKQYLLIPDLILSSGSKYLGYQMGKRYDILPKDFVRRCSMNQSYWNDSK
ncbi:MAG: glycosyltransferase family 2 protein, partial [Mobilitalea sp.]